MGEHTQSCISHYTALAGRLAAFRRAWRLNSAFQGLVAAAIVALLPVIIGAAARVSGYPRSILLCATALSVAAIILLKVLYPLMRPLSLNDLSLLAENREPALENKLTTAVQLWPRMKNGSASFEPVMLLALYVDAAAAARALPIRRVLDLRRPAAEAAAAIIFFSSFAVLLAVKPGAAPRIARFVQDPLFPRPVVYSIESVTGNLTIESATPVTIKARLSGDIANAPSIIIEREGLEPLRATMRPTGKLSFSYKIPSVNSDLSYKIIYRDARSGPWRVTAVELPKIKSLKITLAYPKYSAIPAQELDNAGDITALAGTKATISIASTSELKKAYLSMDGREVPLDISSGAAVASLTIEKDETYSINLTDAHGFHNRMPPTYTIRALPDAVPEIELTQPRANLTIPGLAIIQLSGNARDDYGITTVALHYKLLSGKNSGSIRIPVKPGPAVSFDYNWDLSTIGALQGDTIEYRLSASDNDTVSGPKSAYTSPLQISIMTPRKEYEHLEKQGDEVISRLESAVKETENVSQTFKNLSQNLSTRTDGNWKKSADVQRAVERQQALEQELTDISQRMQDNLSHMKDNDLVSYQTLEKLTQIRQLMDQITTKDMKDLIAKIQKSVENIDITQLDRSLIESMKDQEKILRNLENTLERLKRIQAEQKMNAAAERMKDLAERQKKALEQAQALKDKQKKSGLDNRDRAALDQLARDEKQINEELAEARKKLDALQDDMDKMSPDAAKEIQDALQDFDSRNANGNLSQAEENLKNERLQLGEKNASDAYKAMLSLSSKMQSMKGNYASRMSEAVRKMITRALQKTLDLSAAQEKTIDETARLAEKPGRALADSEADRANSQIRFQRDVASELSSDLYSLAGVSMFVSPDLAASAMRASGLLTSALDMVKENRAPDVYAGVIESYKELNRIALALLEAQTSGQGGGGQSGMDQFMSQLQSLADAQDGLNLMTQQLGSSGLPIPQLGSGLQSLAVQQQMIKDGVGKMMQDSRATGQLGKRLEQIQQQMEQIQKDLRAGNATGEVQRRQSDVLRRLKDATLSLRKETLEDKRVAETGKLYAPVSPAAQKTAPSRALPPDVIIEMNALKKESKLKGYESAIDSYYKSITAPK